MLDATKFDRALMLAMELHQICGVGPERAEREFGELFKAANDRQKGILLLVNDERRGLGGR